MKTVLLKSLKSVLVFACIIGLTDCKKDDSATPASAPPPSAPVAYFTYSPSSNLVAPVNIDFTNASTNADSYVWTYDGTGRTITTTNMGLVFAYEGTYTITLKATGRGGTSTYSKTVTVTAAKTTTTKPTADFSYSPSTNLVAPVSIAFTNSSSNASSYAWDFGDGTTSTSTSPSKQYTKEGTFTVKLTATGSGGSTDVTKTIVVGKAAATVVPTADFTYSTSDLKATFTNTSKNANNYTWNFGDGTTSSSTNPTHDYSKAGTYSVILKASDGKNEVQTTKSVTVTAPVTTANCDWSDVNVTKCAQIVAKKGTRCGEPTSLDVTITNGCNVPIKFYVCIQRSDGVWIGNPDGSFDAGTGVGKSATWYECNTTNKYRFGAMVASDYAKTKCAYPKCD